MPAVSPPPGFCDCEEASLSVAVIEGGSYVFERAAYNGVNGETLTEVHAALDDPLPPSHPARVCHCDT